MYESILLESGKVFVGSRVSGIGANVVDDSRTITIPVLISEGKATIMYITKPDTFTPGVPFNINIQLRNDGGDDKLVVVIKNTDTGDVLVDYTSISIVPSGLGWSKAFSITLTQTTDFHGLIEAGHVED